MAHYNAVHDLNGWEIVKGSKQNYVVTVGLGINAGVIAKTVCTELNLLYEDTQRLDRLEGELEAEQEAIKNQDVTPYSLFRRNVPITRELIDEVYGDPTEGT